MGRLGSGCFTENQQHEALETHRRSRYNHVGYVLHRLHGMADTLTISIGKANERVGYHPFVGTIANTLRLFDAIDREISKDRTPAMIWEITAVSMKSPIEITFQSRAKKGRQSVVFAEDVLHGLQAIARSAIRPPHFSDEAMWAARSMVHALSVPFTLKSNGVRVQPTQHIAANVDSVLGQHSGYCDEAAVDGQLDTISVHGSPQFVIFDAITDRGVKCYFPDDQIGSVVDLLKNRVRVYGTARFNKNDEVVSVEVDSFERLPEQDECPTIKDLHAAQINITGGEDAADYVRRLRDDEED